MYVCNSKAIGGHGPSRVVEDSVEDGHDVRSSQECLCLGEVPIICGVVLDEVNAHDEKIAVGT